MNTDGHRWSSRDGNSGNRRRGERRGAGVVGAVAALVVLGLVAVPADAANPDWPNPDATRAEMADPANWPDDPDYGPNGEGFGGMWELWSFMPPEFTSVPGHREEELDLGAGSHVDRAWQVTIGDPRVVIAVLDTGIYWDKRDLLKKFYLNVGELPVPEGATDHDANGDGVVNIDDYAADTRVTDLNGNGVIDPGDLIHTFSDGVDDDANGYTDDISGWDFFKHDNDPYDETHFGHGTGEARDSTAETNNGIESAGVCPLCRPLMVRCGDSFVTDVQIFAQGVVFAVDSGASVIQEALGTVDMSSFAREAIDYAYDHGVTVVASAADENSFHHNYPGTADHTLYVHAIRYDDSEPQLSTTFLNYNNCTNHGAQLLLSTPGTGCSSEATGKTSGMVGLLYSQALQMSLDPPLRPGEVRQLLATTVDDIWIPYEERVCDDTKYPSWQGWDQRFGYGRTNIRTALDRLRDGAIPPEIDLIQPVWFEVFEPALRPEVLVAGKIAADRAPSFDWEVAWAPGIEPLDGEFTVLASGTAETAAVDGELARLNLTGLTIDNPGQSWNRWTVTFRVRAVAHYGGAIGDAPAEFRKAIAVHHDPDSLPGFPLWMGASGESSPKLADIDGDGVRDVVLATSDGDVHALRHDGTEAPGWPVHVRLLPGMDPADEPGYRDSAAFASALDPDELRSAIVASPAIADLTGDGGLEVVVATEEGEVWAWHADGTVVGGFPVGCDPSLSPPADPEHPIDIGFFASPVLVDLLGDGDYEIVAAAYDSYVYAWNPDGTPVDGFPVLISDPNVTTEPRERARIMTTPAVADFDGDGIMDLAVGSDESYGSGYDGRFYLVHGDGNLHAGGPFHANWPIPVWSAPLFGGAHISRGVPTSAALADVDHDGVVDIATFGNASPSLWIFTGEQPARAPGDSARTARQLDTVSFGRLANSRERPTFNIFSYPSFGDLDQDGLADMVLGGASTQAALNLAAGSKAVAFDHQISAWSGADSRMLPGFARKVEDWQFFMNPSIADVSGDGYPEIVSGSGGYFVHAFDGCGREPAGWPKFTGQWLIAAPAIGDIDGDELLEVVQPTRAGWLYAWNTTGGAEGSISWESFRHDNRNTGNYETPLEHGAHTLAETPLDCSAETPPSFGRPLPDECYPDAGDGGEDVEDAGEDAEDGGDGGPAYTGGGGCSCGVTAGHGTAGFALGLLFLAFGWGRARRGGRARSPD
ncbi:MAG: VCBS repeat-containing protein [Deltaproteobacteria bacterium]|nr:VCBS repeat-containing protein [Deltaproteobacteria bacterium]